MQSVSTKRSKLRDAKSRMSFSSRRMGELSPTGLNFYNDVPSVELDLDTFEVYALKRLKVLRKLEQLRGFKLPRADLVTKVKEAISGEGLENAQVDETSHFILRLSYCQNEELRRWFLLHETELLRIRIQLQKDHLPELVQSKLALKPISEEEKEELGSFLMRDMSLAEFRQTSFFAVPFTHALDLVARRDCYLRAGLAYIPQEKAESILLAKFRAELSRQLVHMGTRVPLESSLRDHPEGSRVYPLLHNLNRCLIHRENTSATDFAGGAETLTAATVGKTVGSMPLCMQEMHRGMMREGKLRHQGRLQYGLFLKGAGLDLDNALEFFKRHFTAVTGEKFQKDYAYNIRYNYGKEGKRVSRSPYACTGIINGSAPGTRGDFHGCPYKNYDVEHINKCLQGMSLADKTEVVALKKAGQYGLACQKQFLSQHPKILDTEIPLENIGNHPNAWYQASRAYHAAQTPPEKNESHSEPNAPAVAKSVSP